MAVDTEGKRRGRTHLSRQTIQLDSSSYEAVAIAVAANRSAAIDANLIAIWSTKPFRFAIGDNSVEANGTSPMLPAISQPMIIDWNPGDFISVLRDSEDGTLHIIGCY